MERHLSFSKASFLLCLYWQYCLSLSFFLRQSHIPLLATTVGIASFFAVVRVFLETSGIRNHSRHSNGDYADSHPFAHRHSDCGMDDERHRPDHFILWNGLY